MSARLDPELAFGEDRLTLQRGDAAAAAIHDRALEDVRREMRCDAAVESTGGCLWEGGLQERELGGE